MTMKQIYETPTTKTLVVRFQGVLCGSYGEQGRAGADASQRIYDEDF